MPLSILARSNQCQRFSSFRKSLMQSEKQSSDFFHREAAAILKPFTLELAKRAVRTRLSQTAIAFKLRFSKPLVRRRLLGKELVFKRVATDVRSHVGD